MGLIVCTSECVYQLDGYCSLERACSGGAPDAENPCVNYIPRNSASHNHGKRFPDVLNADQLKSLRLDQLAVISCRDQALGESKPSNL